MCTFAGPLSSPQSKSPRRGVIDRILPLEYRELGELRSRSELRRDTKSEGIGALHGGEEKRPLRRERLRLLAHQRSIFQTERPEDRTTTSVLPLDAAIIKKNNTRGAKATRGTRLRCGCVRLCEEETQTHTCFQRVSPPPLATPLVPPRPRRGACAVDLAIMKTILTIILTIILTRIIIIMIIMIMTMIKIMMTVVMTAVIIMIMYYVSLCRYSEIRMQRIMSFTCRSLGTQEWHPRSLSFTVKKQRVRIITTPVRRSGTTGTQKTSPSVQPTEFTMHLFVRAQL